MYPIPGHLALSLAGSRLAKLPYGPAIAATFLVDILDKVFSDILTIAPHGRCWFHTLLSVAVCSYLIGKWTHRDWGYSWMVGHSLHLLGDIGFIPWFYPFVSYHWPEAPNMVKISLLGLEETLSGMKYSSAVLRAFSGKLMGIEFVLLLSTIPLLFQRIRDAKLAFSITLTLFILLLGFRLTYDFPVLTHVLSQLFGDWIRV